MSTKPESVDSWQKVSNQDEMGTINENKEESQFISNEGNFNESPAAKPDENFFTKNFDECMKRIQLLEKEHEMVEKTESKIEFFYIRKGSEKEIGRIENYDRVSTDFFEVEKSVESDSESGSNRKEDENHHEANQFRRKESGKESSEEDLKEKNVENCGKVEKSEKDQDNDENDSTGEKDKEIVLEWQPISKVRNPEENEDGDTGREKKSQESKEMSCRIMGATLKNSNENTEKNEEKEPETTRHYFSKLVKSKKFIIDEELPDPDVVRNIRAKFQQNLDSTLKKRLLAGEFGGSLRDISTGKAEQIARPLSVQCNRDDVIKEIYGKTSSERGKRIKRSGKGSTGILKDSDREFSSMERGISEKQDGVMKIFKDSRNGKSSRWTDTGSVSSGVSSDLSSYDTDLESYSREGLEQDTSDKITSDDDLLDEVKDKHYVQNEILDKIRSFGTSVTYYGGEMITCAVGPLLSPTTQAIMEEIGEKYGDESNFSSSFAEFYRKYVESDEPRKKKVGRARSFGQNDVFHKPNVLNNSEIELYKDDLETEIGIRKPKGIQQANLKVHPDKPKNVENKREKHKNEENSMVTTASSPTTETIAEDSIERNDNRNFEQETEFLGKGGERNGAIRISRLNLNEEKKLKLVKSKSSEREETEEDIKSQKKTFFKRSQSTPIDFNRSIDEPEEEKKEIFKSPPKGILFGYDKKLFNGRRIPEIQFETFEVCESETEMNNDDNNRKTEETGGASTDGNSLGSAISTGSISPPPSETEIDRREENNNSLTEEDCQKSKLAKSDFIDSIESNNNRISKSNEVDLKCEGNNHNNNNNNNNNNFRWAIETGVWGDIERLHH